MSAVINEVSVLLLKMTQIAAIQGDQDNNIDLTQHSPGGDTMILSGNDSDGDLENPAPPPPLVFHNVAFFEWASLYHREASS